MLIDADSVELQDAIGRNAFKTRSDIRDLIDRCPTIPAEPIVNARWIHYPDCGVTRCSHCGWSIAECWESKRCPDCGAKMDGGAENG